MDRKGAQGAAVPQGMVRLFAGAALLLVPWTIWLSNSLPVSHLDRHWNLAWTGFDCALICSLALTAYLTWRASGWVVLAATATATLLLTDAWFDTLTARIGPEHAISLVSAVCAEVPLALLSLWIAYRAGRRFFCVEQAPEVQACQSRRNPAVSPHPRLPYQDASSEARHGDRKQTPSLVREGAK